MCDFGFWVAFLCITKMWCLFGKCCLWTCQGKLQVYKLLASLVGLGGTCFRFVQFCLIVLNIEYEVIIQRILHYYDVLIQPTNCLWYCEFYNSTIGKKYGMSIFSTKQRSNTSEANAIFIILHNLYTGSQYKGISKWVYKQIFKYVVMTFLHFCPLQSNWQIHHCCQWNTNININVCFQCTHVNHCMQWSLVDMWCWNVTQICRTHSIW